MSWDAWSALFGMYASQQQGEYVGPRLTLGTTINEWEVEDDMAAQSLGGPFDQFIELARARWSAGVTEYRGGDESKPFDGDPVQEGLEEAADMYAYSKVANEQGLMSDTEADQVNAHAFDAYKILLRVQIANKEKHAKEESRIEKEGRKEEAQKAGLVEG
jgi:hypothetical protein